MPPQAWMEEAKESIQRGYTSIKLKARPWRDIFDQVHKVGSVVPENYKFDIDFNGFLRTADGAGVDAVIAPRNRAVGMTSTVSRISCGASESVPFIQVTNIVRTLKELQKNGVWSVGTADGAEASSLYDVDFKGSMALVMGAEGAGLRRLTQETCDLVVRIPMMGKVDCLNVSVATGVCLYEALRQRQSPGSS